VTTAVLSRTTASASKPLLGAVGQLHLQRPQLGGKALELRHGGDFDHMRAILPRDGVEMLLEMAERCPNGAQQQPARSDRGKDGQDEGRRLTQAAAQLAPGAGIFLPRDTDLKSRQLPVRAVHVFEQRQQLRIVMLLQAGAVSQRGDGQGRFQTVAQKHRAAFLEIGGQYLFLVREVGRHVLRPDRGNPLTALIDLGCERSDLAAFAVLQVESHHGYAVQVRPQAIADLGKLTFRDDAILVDGPKTVIAVAHAAESQPTDQHDCQDQHGEHGSQTADHTRRGVSDVLPPASPDKGALVDAQRLVRSGDQAGICLLRLSYLRAGWLRPDRDEARNFPILDQWGDIGPYPVMIARLRAVLDQPLPRFAGPDRRPEIGEGFFGHVRVAHDIVRGADQFLLGEPADVDKIFVSKCNYSARVRTRYEQITVAEFDLFIRQWAVIAHSSLRYPPLATICMALC
jgi:hypothetical protein